MKKLLLLSILVCMTLLSACEKTSDTTSAVNITNSGAEANIETSIEKDEEVSKTCRISFGESIVDIDFANDRTTHEPSMLTSEKEIVVTVGDYSGYEIHFDGELIEPNSQFKYKIDRLSKDYFLVISYENINTREKGEQYIATLPYAVRDYNVISNVSDGVYYYAHEGYAFKTNHEGKIIFYYRDDTEGARYINEFKKVSVKGKDYYLITAQKTSHEYPSLGTGAGPNAKVIILDENYNECNVISELGKTNRTAEGIPLDQHDFIMLDEDHYILMGYLPVLATNLPNDVPHDVTGSRVVAAVIQEVVDDEVIFEWYSTDYPELYNLKSDLEDYYNKKSVWFDYMHINSFDIDPDDNNFICSFRTCDTMMKIDRKTGDIIWKLSGVGDDFGLTEYQKTSKQHDFRKIGKNKYSVYDNGFDKNQTRIVEYTIDEENKKLIEFNEYFIKGMYSPFQGNAQHIEEQRWLIGGGMWQSASQAFFYDVDFSSNQILFEVIPQVGQNSYDMVYRAYRFDD
ncbi:MAG: arylsulfotransferase family protein [Lachnospiraceae bacterium]|nr:arylsulfotransferase family protein [Lachnospiraceae bacterium]